MFDSGIGGLNAYYLLAKNFPFLRFFYLSDSSNCPYGSKSLSELERLSLSALEKSGVKSFGGVVVACNTLSTNVLPFLRRKLGVPVFGVFPPLSLTGKTLLLCTPKTARSRFLSLAPKNYEVVALKSLAGEVETCAPNFDRVALDELPFGRYDDVILGCTHYIYLERRLKPIYPVARFHDGLPRLMTTFRRFYDEGVFSMTTFLSVDEITENYFLGDAKERNFKVFAVLRDKMKQMF